MRSMKSYMLSLTVVAGLGVLSLPARADNAAVVEQEATQSTAIVGNNNVSITQNIQIGTVIQRGNGRLKLPKNNAILKQRVDQATGISGNGNVVETYNEQVGKIDQSNKRHSNRPNKVRIRHK